MKHKDHYDDAYILFLADKLKMTLPNFDKANFVLNLHGKLEDKELFERFDSIVLELEANLTCGFSDAIDGFYNILGEELQTSSGMFTKGWWLWPIGRYIEKYGLKDWQKSMDFLKELTKRFTGEYAVRPLIKAYPRKSMEIILVWSVDKNVHVRRLASEGLRIRLPWSQKLYAAFDEFELYKKILTNLKDDPDRFVQKSVGNNLNDLFKESHEKANEIIDEWKQTKSLSKEAKWIISHGSRNIK